MIHAMRSFEPQYGRCLHLSARHIWFCGEPVTKWMKEEKENGNKENEEGQIGSYLDENEKIYGKNKVQAARFPQQSKEWESNEAATSSWLEQATNTPKEYWKEKERERQKKCCERTKGMARKTIKMYNLFEHDFDMVGTQSGWRSFESNTYDVSARIYENQREKRYGRQREERSRLSCG